MFKNLSFSIVAILATSMIASAYAADLSGGQGTVNNIREADPPQTSTTTKPSPVGQPITGYKPKANTLKTKEPPSPPTLYNPQGDDGIKAGWDRNQKRNNQ